MRDEHDLNRPRRLPHGYCNETSREGNLVTKRFVGPDAQARAANEARILRAVASVVPVPAVKSVTSVEIVCAYVPGIHGQDLIEPDNAGAVLAACGRTLAAIHAVPPRIISAASHPGTVLVHGDFGPQNLMFRADQVTVSSVFDWEWAHMGHAIEDLAWCEWIIRTHHADCVDALPHLYYAYGESTPSWDKRHAAMLAKCRAMLQFGTRSKDGSASTWRRRIAVTAAWQGL